MAPEVFASFVDQDAVEAEEGDEVGDGHEGVHAIGEVPYHGEIHDATGKHGQHIKHTEHQHPTLALEILHGALAIIAPAEDGGEGERQ